MRFPIIAIKPEKITDLKFSSMLKSIFIVFLVLSIPAGNKFVYASQEKARDIPVLLAMADVQQTSSESDVETDNEEVSSTETPSDFVLFIGRFHPLIVHLPIGFLLLAFLLECFALHKKFEQVKYAVPLVLSLGAFGAILAAIAGYMLSYSGGYGDNLLNLHKWLGITVAGLALLALVFRVKLYNNSIFRKVYGGILVLMILTLMAAGHYGGTLTHGSGYLTRYMPKPFRSLAGLPPVREKKIKVISNIDSALVYEDIIHPILDVYCTGCHNPIKKKGELLLTSFDEVMQGGENGPVLKAGNSGQSELFKRITLPEQDEDHMPPEGKKQLTDDQIDLIAWWINLGAPAGQKVAQLQVPAEISEALKKLTGEEEKGFLAKTKVPKADEKIVENLREQGILVSPVAQDKNFLQVRFTKPPDSIGKKDIESLIPLSEQVTWLDLGRIPVTDTDLSSLSVLKNLTRLHLEHTNIGDSTLAILSSLENLKYLNLYATGISDKGLKYLENNKNLESLYLWQTNVSEEAVQNLKKKLPELYVNTGWETKFSVKQERGDIATGNNQQQ